MPCIVSAISVVYNTAKIINQQRIAWPYKQVIYMFVNRMFSCCVYLIYGNSKMKIAFFFLFIGITLPTICYAGNIYPGIFSTSKDFRRNQITIKADTSQPKSIIIDDFFFRPYVWIKTSSAKLKMQRKDVFAVRMPNKELYRIVENENYKVLDTSNICIYAKEKIVCIPQKRVHSTTHKYIKKSEYFFSRSISDSILEFNLANIRLSLLSNKQMDNNLLSHFPTHESLCVRKENGQFEINSFLNSINK